MSGILIMAGLTMIVGLVGGAGGGLGVGSGGTASTSPGTDGPDECLVSGEAAMSDPGAFAPSWNGWA